MEKKSRSWSIAMTYNLSYIAFRMKIPAPLPHMLYCRVKDVFYYFDNRKDTKTPSPLFNDNASKKSDCVLKAILRGEYSDPTGPLCEFYCQKRDNYGQYMVDKDGL